MINREIKSEFVKLIDSESKQLKQVSLEQAIEMAEETGEDVVCVNNNSDIPIVKICDYSKELYKKKKKEKDIIKKNKQNRKEFKEIKLSSSIAEHDLKVKAKNIDKMLSSNSMILISVVYKGRTIKLMESDGKSKITTLLNFLSEQYKKENDIQMKGNTVSIKISSV